jgi:adenine-specific DNA-methyltransferase
MPYGKYDIVISNPPYKKIGKNDAEASTMSELVYGQPNLYFLFMAMGAHLLKPNGEFVYIVPRSFTSGLYFSAFRKWFSSEMTYADLHLFASRDQVFADDGVLQETIIVRAEKASKKRKNISITQSADGITIETLAITVPYDLCVGADENQFLYLPTSVEDIEVLEFINRWEHTLCDIGFKMKTGVVVDFRETLWLRTQKEADTIPLLWSYNLKDNRMIFPIKDKAKPQYLLTCPSTAKLQMKVDNYVILKRFTSKEEPRRIQCALLMKEDFMNYTSISTENHLNFITKMSGDMLQEEMFGIFVVLNSGYMDRYFRILNGSTQVNANEINSIPFPSYDDVLELGIEAMQHNHLTEKLCDDILERKYKSASTIAV